MTSRIGIMQGRLSRPLNGRIQSFPINTWEKEFYLAKEIGFELIEWVLDENIKDNPIDALKKVELKYYKDFYGFYWNKEKDKQQRFQFLKISYKSYKYLKKLTMP